MISDHGESGGCLCWPFRKRADGYGTVYYEKRLWRVHRLAFKLTNGRIYKALQVLHSCDNPPCFNPKHLFQGTQLDNMRDMIAKGRQFICSGPNPLNAGSRNGNAKLTDEMVKSIRLRHQSGEMQKDIAADLCISKMTVSLVVRNLIWKHVN